MANPKTISLLLNEGTSLLREKNLENPRLEAELLLCATLSLRRIDLMLHKNDDVLPKKEGVFLGYLKRRAQREPLQYITGEVEFYGLKLFSERGVFIPRPETELMVEEAKSIRPTPHTILDLCTGSGALAVALATCFPSAQITAIDCCEKALSLARLNARRHQCASRFTFLQGDLFKPLESIAAKPQDGQAVKKVPDARPQGPRRPQRTLKVCEDLRGTENEADGLLEQPAREFDLIVCNPPYVPEEDRPYLQPEVRDYEPAVALFAKKGEFYRRILRAAPSYLSSRGSMLLELGDGQAVWFKDFVEKETVFKASTLPDFSGIERVALLRKAEGINLG